MADVSTVSTAWAVFSVVGGSLLGASISAAVAFWTQKRTLAAAKLQRDDDRYETRRAQCYSLLFKMIRIHSSIAILEKAVIESRAKAEASGIKGDLWQKLTPMGNVPPRVKFTSEEMALLLSLDFNLFNVIGPYDDIHNSMLDLFEVYGAKRATLMERFGAKMTGAVGSVGLTQAELDWMAPRAVELESIAKAIVERTAHDSPESKNLLERLHALFVREFKINPKLEFKPGFATVEKPK
jgi:hypothetical protein